MFIRATSVLGPCSWNKHTTNFIIPLNFVEMLFIFFFPEPVKNCLTRFTLTFLPPVSPTLNDWIYVGSEAVPPLRSTNLQYSPSSRRCDHSLISLIYTTVLFIN